MSIKFVSFRGFNVYIIVDFVKCGVQTLISEIRRYRNDRYIIIIVIEGRGLKSQEVGEREYNMYLTPQYHQQAG